MNAIVRLKDICDIDFAPGKSLYPVEVEETGRFLAPHEVDQLQVIMRSGILTRRSLFGLGAIGALGLLMRPDVAEAANTVAWIGGNLNAGTGWVTAVGNSTTGLATLANGSSILDGADVTNGTAFDLFADLSHSMTIASSTILAGAAISYWIYSLNQDGTTYGDNHLTTTAAAVTPSAGPSCAINCFPGATQTSIIGNSNVFQPITLPPGTFRWAMQNNSGFAFTAATIKFRSYITNVNR